jgi:hypothetical protein
MDGCHVSPTVQIKLCCSRMDGCHVSWWSIEMIIVKWCDLFQFLGKPCIWWCIMHIIKHSTWLLGTSPCPRRTLSSSHSCQL